MDDMEIPKGTPWLDKPMALHAYREFECQFNNTELCDYVSGYWRFWYEADHRYAIPTIAFFLATILVFSIVYLLDLLASGSIKSSSLARRSTAVFRFLSYRTFRIPFLNWNSASLGVLVLGAIGIIYFFCMTLAPTPYYWPATDQGDFGSSPPIATRAGWLSLACLPFVFATAGKSNFITAVTGVSHEKLQVFHRWISYAFFITALIHTFPFIIYNIQTGAMVSSWNTTVFYWTGVIALIAQAYLTFASISPLRSMSYEWFKFSHFVAALVFVLFLFFHCDHTLSAWDYFIATGTLFALSWLHRQVRVYFEHGIRHQAHLSLTDNGFICVRIPTSATWGVGQHFFVRFLSFGLHIGSIHPFTACSLPTTGNSFAGKSSELVLYIRPRGGLTAHLAQLAESQPNTTIRVLLDGPYGGIDSRKLTACNKQLIIAGGSGAGWLRPMIKALLRQHKAYGKADSQYDQSHSVVSAKVVLTTRDATTEAWFDETLKDLLASANLADLPKSLQFELHHTGSARDRDHEKALPTSTSSNTTADLTLDIEKAPSHQAFPVSHSSSGSASSSGPDASYPSIITHFANRPNLPVMVRSEASTLLPNQQLGVFVCGPLSMQHDVANAVADEQRAVLRSNGSEGGGKGVYLHMEHFSWA